MQRFFLTVDKISTWLGQLAAWAIVILTVMICWEVFSRYALGAPHAWVFDVQIMLYGTVFMMAGAYTLAKNGHVRGDILYGFMAPRTQAFFDLVLYIVFFVPGILALASADGPPIYPFKAIIPIAGVLLSLQGLVEILRCVVCLRTGQWPSREEDVEEVDVEKLKAMVSQGDDPVAPAAPVRGA